MRRGGRRAGVDESWAPSTLRAPEAGRQRCHIASQCSRITGLQGASRAWPTSSQYPLLQYLTAMAIPSHNATLGYTRCHAPPTWAAEQRNEGRH
jgi:hypothetical protein